MAAHQGALLLVKVAQVGVGRGGIGQHAAKIGDGLGRRFEALLGQQVAHVGPGIEGLDKTRQVHRRMRPSQRGHVLAQPDLEGLRGHRLDLGHHVAPARLAGDQLGRQTRQGANAHPQHHEVEILRHPQRQGAGAGAVPVGLELDAGGLQRGAALQLCKAGLRRPAGQALHIHQRLVVGAVGRLGLHIKLQRLHPGHLAGLGRRQRQLAQAVEEGELDAARLQHLVERRKHHIAHAGAHAVEQRAAVGEEHPHGAAQRHPGGQARARDVAVLEGKGQVVDGAQKARLQRRLGRAVGAQPVAPVLIVDGVEATRVKGQALQRGAAQDGQDQVYHLPEAAQLGVSGGQPLGVLAGGARQGLDQPDQQGTAIAQRLRQPAVDGLQQQLAGLGCGGQAGELAVAQQGLDRRADGLRAAAARVCSAWPNGLAGGLAGAGRAQQLGHQQGRLAQVGQHGEGAALAEGVARLATAGCKVGPPRGPVLAQAVGHCHIGRWLEGIAPAGEAGLGVQLVALGIAGAHQGKGVLVEAHPQVQAVLLDALRGPAPRGALAAQAPAQLVNSDLVAALVLGPAQLEGCRQAGTTAADDGHTLGWVEGC